MSNNNSSNNNSVNRKTNGATLPKVTEADKVKSALLKLLKIPEKGLEKAKVIIVKDGKKIEVVVKTDISKLKNDIFHLLHHKNLSKEAINANTNTRDFTITVPEELVPTVEKLADEKVDIDSRIEVAEQKLKELGINIS